MRSCYKRKPYQRRKSVLLQTRFCVLCTGRRFSNIWTRISHLTSQWTRDPAPNPTPQLSWPCSTPHHLVADFPPHPPPSAGSRDLGVHCSAAHDACTNRGACRRQSDHLLNGEKLGKRENACSPKVCWCRGVYGSLCAMQTPRRGKEKTGGRLAGGPKPLGVLKAEPNFVIVSR